MKEWVLYFNSCKQKSCSVPLVNNKFEAMEQFERSNKSSFDFENMESMLIISGLYHAQKILISLDSFLNIIKIRNRMSMMPEIVKIFKINMIKMQKESTHLIKLFYSNFPQCILKKIVIEPYFKNIVLNIVKRDHIGMKCKSKLLHVLDLYPKKIQSLFAPSTSSIVSSL